MKPIDSIVSEKILEEIYYISCKKGDTNIFYRCNFAGALLGQGKYNDAYQIYQEVFTFRKNKLGENHPDTLTTHYQIAETLRAQGEYKKTLDIFQEVFEKQSSSTDLESNNKHAVLSQFGIARSLDGLGKFNDALKIHLEVLIEKQTIFGENNIELISSYEEIANIYYKLKKFNELSGIYRKALEIIKTNLGENSIDFLSKKYFLGAALFHTEEYKKALKVLKEVYERLKKCYPDELKSLLCIKNNIAITTSFMQEFDEAKNLFGEVLLSQEAIFGKDHNTNGSTKIIFCKAVSLIIQENYKEAFKHFLTLHSKIMLTCGEIPQIFVDINKTKESSSTVARDLILAVKNDELEKVEYLIENGGNFNFKDIDNISLLHYAVDNKNINIVNILLQKGADICQFTNEGKTPLHIAASKGNEKIVKTLLLNVTRDKLNKFIDAKTFSDGTTSLHVAAQEGFLNIVKILLEYSATYDIKNKQNQTPIDLSKNQNVTHFLKLIEESFENAKNGNIDFISKLKTIEKDELVAIISSRNSNSHTLLQVAIKYKHRDIASNLIELLKNQN